CAEYKDAHEIEKQGKSRKDAALAEIKTLMEDANTAIADDGFKVKASLIKEATIERKAHRRFSINKAKEQ
ncbi:MAG: hypothetical protein WD558_04395, partial [Pseudomonadales bacterium]